MSLLIFMWKFAFWRFIIRSLLNLLINNAKRFKISIVYAG
jgi:hypothetical protein